MIYGSAKNYYSTALSCVYLECFNVRTMFVVPHFHYLYELGVRSYVRPLNIEWSDPILLRFCTLLRHTYARIRTFYLPYRAFDLTILRCEPR